MPRKVKVLVSYAQSLDGHVATATGASRWISGPESLEYAHCLRRENEAILVGSGTVVRDNPLLTCRLPGARSPRRVLLDSGLRIPLGSQVVQTAEAVPTVIFTTAQRLDQRDETVTRFEQAGVILRAVPSDTPGQLSLSAVLDTLEADGVTSLFVEGGSRVITAFLKAGLVDEWHLVMAPIIIGAGIPAVGDLGVRDLAEAYRFETRSVTHLGEDLLWKLVRRQEQR